MKKLLSIVLVLIMLFSLSACSMTREQAEELGQLAGELIEAALDDSDSEAAAAPEAETDPKPEEETVPETPEAAAEPPAIDRDGAYTTKEDVSLYLFVYGCLPENFMTKNEAKALGWNGGGLDGYADGMCIGGDRFGNYEKLLPEAPGRKYFECDIDTLHASSRGAKRIIFSNDGLIYYTSDHYESFTLLYGEE